MLMEKKKPENFDLLHSRAGAAFYLGGRTSGALPSWALGGQFCVHRPQEGPGLPALPASWTSVVLLPEGLSILC